MTSSVGCVALLEGGLRLEELVLGASFVAAEGELLLVVEAELLWVDGLAVGLVVLRCTDLLLLGSRLTIATCGILL